MMIMQILMRISSIFLLCFFFNFSQHGLESFRFLSVRKVRTQLTYEVSLRTNSIHFWRDMWRLNLETVTRSRCVRQGRHCSSAAS